MCSGYISSLVMLKTRVDYGIAYILQSVGDCSHITKMTPYLFPFRDQQVIQIYTKMRKNTKNFRKPSAVKIAMF